MPSLAPLKMDSQIRLLVEALDLIRARLDLSVQELAWRSGSQRATISRLFIAKRPNPTLDTFRDRLKALHVTAEIRFRSPQHDEPESR